MNDIREKTYNMLQKNQNLYSWATRARILLLHIYAYMHTYMCVYLINTTQIKIIYYMNTCTPTLYRSQNKQHGHIIKGSPGLIKKVQRPC